MQAELVPVIAEDQVEPLVREAMQKYARDYSLGLDDLETILGKTYSRAEMQDELLRGVKRGEYLVDDSHFPHKYRFNKDRKISGEAAEQEENRKIGAGHATGITSRIRTLLKEMPRTTEELTAILEQEGFTKKQVSQNISANVSQKRIVGISGTRPKQYKINDKRQQSEVVVPFEQRKPQKVRGLQRDIFHILAETGQRLTARELVPLLKYKWKDETVSSALSSAYFHGVLSREPGSMPYKYYVEYNKRVKYNADLNATLPNRLPKKLLEIDPIVDSEQDAKGDVVEDKGDAVEEATTFMGLDVATGLPADGAAVEVPPPVPVPVEVAVVAEPVAQEAQVWPHRSAQELALDVFDPLLDVHGNLHFHTHDGERFKISRESVERLAWLIRNM